MSESLSHTERTTASTRNACRLCAPLGAALVFKGIQGALPLLHGSQGCSTYIRRYVIGHFREPIDIATSGFSESSAIFGGRDTLLTALDNVVKQYNPALIGVATTCLTETIGDDVKAILREFAKSRATESCPELVHVSTPSYSGSHADGFHNSVHSVLASLARTGPRDSHINVLPGMLSPQDLRHLRELCEHFGLSATLLPDYSDTLDGPAWATYQSIPQGGTPLAQIHRSGSAAATLELGWSLQSRTSGGSLLQQCFDVPLYQLGVPIGINETDQLCGALERISGRKTPASLLAERGRLIDSYVDGHKYVFGKRAIVYGDEDMVIGLTALLSEIGMSPVLCATGASSEHFGALLRRVAPTLAQETTIVNDADFATIQTLAESLSPDIVIGSSKGFGLARELKVPLVRVGFPIHDRIGAQRIQHVGYSGAQQLFDRIVNALIDAQQTSSDIGYLNY
jgi:nitrogenase molybdenum-iron protein NifN